MPIGLTRQRGKRQVWYAAGTVRYGEKTQRVDEHSTGQTAREKAEQYCRREESRIERELAGLAPPERRDLSWVDYPDVYTGVINQATEPRLARIAEWFAARTDGPDKVTSRHWNTFLETELAGLHPNTHHGYYRVFIKLMRDYGLEPPKIRAPGEKVTVVKWLSTPEANALLSAYRVGNNEGDARRAAMLARFQGFRAGEIARLELRHCDFARIAKGQPVGSITIMESKTGKPRTVPMHPAVRADLMALTEKRKDGRVCLNRHGKPYADTRGVGGNPFSKAHRTAVDAASVAHPDIKGFRFHDWRHHWATWCIRMGVDLPTLKSLGGWSSLSALEKYVHVDFEHMSEKLAMVP